jgi:hypothetical protein
MSFAALPISGGPTVPTSESDIRLNYINNRKIIAAANNANGGLQRQFYSDDGGQIWYQTTLPYAHR